MGAAESHRHHVIPKFWLRNFADEQTKLHRVNVYEDQTRPVPVYVRSATVRQDFYVLDGLEETYDVEERQTMQRLDNDGARIFAKLVGADNLSSVWPLSGSDRNALSAFLTAQVLRTPKFRDHSQQVAEHQISRPDRPAHAIDLFRNGVITGDPATLEKVRRYYGVWMPGEQAPSNFHAQVFRDNFNLLHKHLFGMRWMLMRSPSPTYVLSDNPVALVRDMGPTYPPPLCTVNYAEARVMITALSRDLVLVADWHPAEVLKRAPSNGDRVVPYGAGRAHSALACLVANAEEVVYNHPEDKRLRDMLIDGVYDDAPSDEER